MAGRIVLCYDVGTQSTRAMLIDQEGNILFKERARHEPAYFSRETDWAEQEADFYFDKLCETSLRLRGQAGAALWQQIEGVALTAIRATSVCVGKDGRPLRPAFLWLDKRKARGSPAMSPLNRTLFRTVRMEKAVTAHWKVSPCNWMRENEPEIWARTDKFLLLSGYLIYRLSGQMLDSVSGLVGYVPFDHRRRKWMGKNAMTRFLFDIPRHQLPGYREAGEKLGTITQEAAQKTGLRAGLPLFAAGADKACETLGLGCVDTDQAAISFGTTSTVTFTIDRYVEPERFVPAYASMLPGCVNPEVEIFRGYWLLSWFKREFAAKEVQQAKEMGIDPEALLNKRLKEIPAGCEGLVFQPYFTPNLTMPHARGSVIGFSDVHTRIHLYRSIIEGINFALMGGLYQMEKRANVRVKELRLGGGGAQSDEICQITANMFGLPCVRTQTTEVSGIGAAVAAFVGLGVYRDLKEGIRHMVRKQDVFLPDEAEHRVYGRIYRDIFLKVNGRLTPLYMRQKEIVKELSWRHPEKTTHGN